MNQKKTLGTGLEKRVVERAKEAGLKSTKQPLSGILKDYPNDVTVGNLLGECKVRTAALTQSGHKQLTLDMTWLDKVEENAQKVGLDWGVVIVNMKGARKPKVIVDLDYFLALLRKTI